MNATEDRKRFEQAEEQGKASRRNGGKRADCPYRSGSMETQRTAWLTGWDFENMMRRKR